MTLAQEKAFKPGSPFKARLAYDLPTRDYEKAEVAMMRLREQYDRMKPSEKREVEELMEKAWRTLLTNAKAKKRFTARERTEFWRIAMLYSSFAKLKKIEHTSLKTSGMLFDDVDDE